jgi:hypothetical protein
MKKMLFLGLLSALIFTGCADDRLIVVNNSDRVSELERRAALNDQLNVIQNQRLDALEAMLAKEISDRELADQNLQDLLTAETSARIAGDSALAVSLATQALTNVLQQAQINSLNLGFILLNSRINTLTSRVNNLREDLTSLESEVSQLAADMQTQNSLLEAQIDAIEVQQAATQSQLDQEGVKLYKCNSASSTERIMKINGKFYAAVNRVTTSQVRVITGSSSQTFSNPKLCLKDDKTKLPGGNGQCPNSWTEVGGNTVVVPSYSTSNRTVVTEVKIALDLLVDGNYSTTDAGPTCNFTISNNGTTSTNLIPVQ